MNLKYVTENCVLRGKSTIDAGNRRITNVKTPTTRSDAVTVKYLMSKAPVLEEGKSSETYWGFSNKRLTSVADPVDMSDGVTVNYLVRVLSQIFYELYKRLAPQLDAVFVTDKEEWIRVNLVDPFFINANTKIARSGLQ